MSELVKPVIESLIKQGDERGSFQFMQPIYLQIVKLKVKDDTKLIRLSDSVWSIAVRGDSIGKHDLEMFRILKLTQYSIERVVTDDTSRLFLEVYGWEDQGPAASSVGKSSSLKMSDVQQWLHKSEVPIAGQGPEWEPSAASATSSVSAAAPNTTTAASANGTTAAPKPSNQKLGIVPIEAISPFIQSWKIFARCTKKSDIREFNYRNQEGTGKMFKVTFTDETGDIEATGFTEAVDTFYPKIVEGQQYYVSKMTVREANQRFSTSGHDFDLTFNRDTIVEPALDAEVSLPQVYFKFVPSLADLPNHEINSNVDAIGVISDVQEPQEIVSKSSNIPYKKRDIELVDDTMTKTKLTLWGTEAEKFEGHVGSVLAVKGARLTDFGGVSLSTNRQSKVLTDLDDAKAHKLRGWYEAVGSTKDASSFQATGKDQDANGSAKSKERKLVNMQEVTQMGLGQADKPQYFQIKARIAVVYTTPLVYPACSLPNCQKKVIQTGDQWRCEKCDQSMDEPNWRYVMSMILSDVTSDETTPPSTIRISVFDQAGRTIYGDRALEFQQLKEQGPQGERNRALEKAVRCVQGEEYIWNVQSQLETYQGEQRTRFQAMSVKKIDPAEESSRLLSQMGF